MGPEQSEQPGQYLVTPIILAYPAFFSPKLVATTADNGGNVDIVSLVLKLATWPPCR